MSGGLEGTVAINPEHSAHCVTTQSHDNHAVIMHLSQQDSLCSPPPSSSHRTLSRGHTLSAGDGPWCQPCAAAARPLTHSSGTLRGHSLASPAQPSLSSLSPTGTWALSRGPLPARPVETKYRAPTSQACPPEPRTLTQQGSPDAVPRLPCPRARDLSAGPYSSI